MSGRLPALLSIALLCGASPAHAQDWASLDRQAEELYTKGDLKEAIRVAGLALAAASGPKQSARSMDRLGFFEYTSGDQKDGESHLRQALELRKTDLGIETSDYAESANDLALFCRDSAKLPEARTLAEQAVAIRSRVLGARDLRVAESLNTLGSVVALMGEYDLAISRFEEARAIHESQTAPADLGEEYGTLCINLAGTTSASASTPRPRPCLKRDSPSCAASRESTTPRIRPAWSPMPSAGGSRPLLGRRETL